MPNCVSTTSCIVLVFLASVQNVHFTQFSRVHPIVSGVSGIDLESNDTRK